MARHFVHPVLMKLGCQSLCRAAGSKHRDQRQLSQQKTVTLPKHTCEQACVVFYSVYGKMPADECYNKI
eukprot:1142481-Pelagomonas_calceolata.AAC.4